MIEFIRHVYPGDIITEEGPKCFGIFNNKSTIAGQLCRIEDLYFVRSKTKKYTPTKHDIVIGRIIHTSPDYYKVDLCGCTGYLPCLSFMNATKRSRPELQKDDYVLCQVIRVDSDPLLCCKQDGMGKIDEAFPIESWKIRLLYFGDKLKEIGKNRKFRIGMGMNGYVWIDGDGETKRDVLRLISEIN